MQGLRLEQYQIIDAKGRTTQFDKREMNLMKKHVN